MRIKFKLLLIGFFFLQSIFVCFSSEIEPETQRHLHISSRFPDDILKSIMHKVREGTLITRLSISGRKVAEFLRSDLKEIYRSDVEIHLSDVRILGVENWLPRIFFSYPNLRKLSIQFSEDTAAFCFFKGQLPLFKLRLEGLQNLRSLSLSSPDESYFSKDKFIDPAQSPCKILLNDVYALTKLVSLRINRCELNVLQDKIGVLKELVTLDLSDNFLGSDFLENICILETLKHLNISKCGLEKLPREFRKLTNLENLDLSDNPFRTNLPCEIFVLNKLLKLKADQWVVLSLWKRDPSTFRTIETLELEDTYDMDDFLKMHPSVKVVKDSLKESDESENSDNSDDEDSDSNDRFYSHVGSHKVKKVQFWHPNDYRYYYPEYYSDRSLLRYDSEEEKQNPTFDKDSHYEGEEESKDGDSEKYYDQDDDSFTQEIKKARSMGWAYDSDTGELLPPASDSSTEEENEDDDEY